MSAVETAPRAARLQGVALEYPGKVPVRALDGLDLQVGWGEYVSVVGRSGSGKSSLLALLGALRRPTSGSLELCGVPAPSGRAMTRLRRTSLAFVFQDFQLLRHLSAFENVLLGDRYGPGSWRDRRDRALHLLATVGLADRGSHRPPELSGGEQQRVAIARALMRQPSMLLADEPTGNLDTATGHQVLTLLEELRGPAAALVLVTHAPEVARRADRIVRLADGRVAGTSP